MTIVWAIAWNSGIRKFDFNSNSITSYSTEDGLNYPWSVLIETTPDGHVWISHVAKNCFENCPKEGVSHFNGEKWEAYTIENGLPGNEIRSIAAFSENEAYIGGENGISLFNGESLVRFDDGYVVEMAQGPDGALWAAMWNPDPVYKKYHNGTIQTFERIHLYPPKKIIVDFDENIWTLQSNRLYKTKSLHPVFVNEINNNESIDIFSSPNPFNPKTSITITIPKDGHVMISVYNIHGQKISTLSNCYMQAGKHTVLFTAGNIASGIYFCHLTYGGKTYVNKMMLLR